MRKGCNHMAECITTAAHRHGERRVFQEQTPRTLHILCDNLLHLTDRFPEDIFCQAVHVRTERVEAELGNFTPEDFQRHERKTQLLNSRQRQDARDAPRPSFT